MNKIRLNLDALRIESFATTDADGRTRGTVRGHDYATAFGYPSCPGGASVPREGCIDSASGMHDCICGDGSGTPECLPKRGVRHEAGEGFGE
jgi:hypothetical protein